MSHPIQFNFSLKYCILQLTNFGNNAKHTMCVKDCGLHNRNIDMIILFACLAAWLDSTATPAIDFINVFLYESPFFAKR